MSGAIWLAIALWFLSPPLAEASALGDARSPDINLVRIGLSLALCLITAAAAIILLRRKGLVSFGQGTQGPSIRVRETKRISVSAELCRFECDGRESLMVVTPQSATVLRERAIDISEQEQ